MTGILVSKGSIDHWLILEIFLKIINIKEQRQNHIQDNFKGLQAKLKK